eukprot:gnl/TRDRNA2_/TRDRNA2_146278_c0_seq1.p1 gnl/TRDRNA2_/TRDRNA2_146278_c0~~gnl/TRDRNA2_/TRDRNA2_146278_c0_seq1.p1  ORF type:complete len:164 (+),score=20.38 gnl/TRDRNA2_/TRDRNA2_146278_c0_seq1:57-548(+)
MVAEHCTCPYRYGGLEVAPQVFPPWMYVLMKAFMPFCGLADPRDQPTCCNLNLYEGGSNSVGWHADDEQLFQGKFRDCRIISLSLGARRSFEVRLNWPEPGEKPLHQLMLGDGDLCTMEGMLQKHCQHRAPPEGHVTGERINITWRWVVKHTPRCPAPRFRGV